MNFLELHTRHNDHRYSSPSDLGKTDVGAIRILVVGSCFSEGLTLYLNRIFPEAKADHIMYNFAGDLPDPPNPLESYAFQVIILPLRTVMPESLWFRLKYNEPDSFSQAYGESEQRLLQLLDGALKYNTQAGLLTFVANFMVPQQNAMGKLLHRYDLRNPCYYVEQLNKLLYEELESRNNVYLLDADQVSANFGKKHIQDDCVWATTHGAYANDWDHYHDQNRIEPPRMLSEYYILRTEEFILALWNELIASYKIARQIDQVKIMIFDLDDTLWRGVVAESGMDNPAIMEGWPLGLLEALLFLKKRGVLLAIVSKNNEETIRQIWNDVFKGLLLLDDFVSIKINWNPKSENIEEILKETNLLPKSAVFVDDNPRERHDVSTAFPEIRTLGAHPYLLKRTILWAPETQVPYISDESGRRTEMIHAQIQREDTRKRLSKSEFLESLELAVRLFRIESTDNEKFNRAFELLNKSNQFNTTGKRWAIEECLAGFANGMTFWVFEVDDRFSQYGLVGVAIIEGSHIRQFVMSCRVFGLDAELAAIAAITGFMQTEVNTRITATVTETESNILCRDLFQRSGFILIGDEWVLAESTAATQVDHIKRIDLISNALSVS